MSRPNTKPDGERMSLRIEAIWKEAESRILKDIVRRIKQYGKITSTADYQINRLIEMGKSTEEIERLLKEALNATYPEMYKLYDDVSNWQYVRNRDIYEQINREFIPPEDNEELKQISFAIESQTADALSNIAQSYGFTVPVNGKMVFTPFAEYWQKYVDEAIMDITSGGFDYNTVIRRIVTQMTNSGLRIVDYASGRSFRVPVAARMAVMTGMAQITGKVAEYNAAKLGTDYFEIDWHAGARPEHRVWQGKVYSHQQLIDVCGLGTATGLHGINCYHDFFPFIPGISERLYTDEWLEEQNRKEEETKVWNGKEYNLYEQTQMQRKMETAMRAQREKVQLLKEAGVDEEEIMLARAKYQAQLGEYAQFSNKMGLVQQRERIYYDMRGRIAPNNGEASKFPKEMIKNADKDAKQYRRYKELLGNDIGTLAEFGWMKYNDSEKWKFVELDYQRRNQLKLHPELKLPNAESVVLPEGKFTKYLFEGEHLGGLAKGKAFTSRLGYDISNWKELQAKLKECASKYPAINKGITEYGTKYEQQIILYGKKNMPANVIVGWMHRPDGIVSMSSVYIKEVK